MTEFFVPGAVATAEFTEKKSRFIGHVWPVESEEAARDRIAETRAKHYDARHNCWCYLLRGGVMRYSDDGEPQGTAGQPMLEVFRREGVENVCCVVTRYFGGVLLGAGGLLRAYTRSAKDALDAAGICTMRRRLVLALDCPYPLLERVKLMLAAQGGVIDALDYSTEVAMRLLLPEEGVEVFSAGLTELSAGAVALRSQGERFVALPREK